MACRGPDLTPSEKAKVKYYQKNRDKCIQRSKDWRIANRERYNKHFMDAKARDPEFFKRRARGYALKRKYGITLEQYDELLTKQDGCCAICERHHTEFKTPLAVDHSHKKRTIRGLLCTACNYRLVARHESGELLRKIADYIEQDTGWVVPEQPKRKRKKRAKNTSA